MAQAKVTWHQDRIFVGTDSTKHSVVISTPGENIFEKKRTPLDELEIHVQGEQNEDPPWMYKNIKLSYRIKGEGVTAEAVKRTIELSEEKYCSVSASLKGQVSIDYDFEIVGDDD